MTYNEQRQMIKNQALNKILYILSEHWGMDQFDRSSKEEQQMFEITMIKYALNRELNELKNKQKV